MRKGWYIIKGVQDGDRTVGEQLTGMGDVVAYVRDRRVLDFGCAEALIDKHLVEVGHARACVGLSLVPSEIETGRSQCAGLPIDLHACNLDHFAAWADGADGRAALAEPFDVVLLLSILHKLQDPAAFLRRAMALAGSMIVVRLPMPTIVDSRSGFRPVPIPPILQAGGWQLAATPRGPRGEWQSIWMRATPAGAP